ncbi:beta-N-acetylhexosaminidase [Sphingomonas sp. Sph1(2015)]|jgi:hexosaminidase|uniref:family 20 glycosylhydrolase n=1 Tax=Sphingomonas sp. Sph1(2015) TaxID=1628084 RepID=UPI0009785EBA|nr:family 20 glycosylhydrolase [Sphingomonas sp. Sph1(2015)]OMJ33502.1 beta-N-acetylhexosaminidase [Sphingomonas sp. Sph1(2015)]
MMTLWASAAILAAAPAAQADLDRLAATLGYRYTILTNRPASCPTGVPRCFEADIAIAVPDSAPSLPVEIRYSLVNPVLKIDSEVFDNRTINGDLNVLTLKPGQSLKSGQTYHVKLTGLGAFFSRNHMMPNAMLAAKGLTPRVIAATRTGTDADTGLETLPFVALMTDEAALARSAPDDQTVWRTPERAFALYAERGAATPVDVAILPKPMTATRPAGAPIDLSKGLRVAIQGFTRAAIAPALAGLPVGTVPLTIRKQSGIAPEGYRLTIADGGVTIAAADAAGASYALRSLAQQMAAEGTTLRPLIVEDAPRYGFRGLHIDLARNFHSKAEILKLIELMAAYKLNTLHLHLGDDEGWRLQIAGLPELTEVGAYRCFDLTEKSCLSPQLGADPARDATTNGYLTAADYTDILRAATARQIAVIPSFDMPGHSRAAIRSMEVRYQRLMAKGDKAGAERFRLVEPGDTTRYSSVQHYDDNTLNVCIPSTYRFIDAVIDTIAGLHKAAGVPLTTYHIGADETAGAWVQSPACKGMMAKTGMQPKQLGAYFIERISADLARRGIAVAGWSDGLGHTDPAKMPANVQTNIWSNLHAGGVAEAHGQANRGWKTVLSIPDLGYFDMPYAADPNETGYDWASRGVDSFQVFGFMPGNLAANAALIPNILTQPKAIADSMPLQSGRSIAGIQAQLWSETVRRDSQVDYMLFPRLLALAERAWSKPDWEPAYVAGTGYEPNDPRVDRTKLLAGWRDFAGRMGVQMRLLDRAGVTYRLAPPGARVSGGKLEANAEFAGTPIEYRTGGSSWTRYTGPVAVTGAVELRIRTPDGRRASRTVTVSP